MKRSILVLSLLVSFAFNLYAQLTPYNILILKRDHRVYQDTSSEYYLKKYGDRENLIVQIRDGYEYDNLQIFKNAPNVQKIVASSNSLTSLSGLEYLRNLKTLSFEKNSITDFKALSQISEIESLSISSNILIDFPLRYKKLKVLTYTGNYEIDKCYFPSLTNLTIRSAVAEDAGYDDENYGVNFKRAKPCCKIDLSNFDSLESIQIHYSHIENISEITLPENVKNLSIDKCVNLKKLDDLKNFTSLEKLNISFCNKVEDFSFLSNLDNTDWRVRYMGKVYRKDELKLLLNHPKEKYHYADSDGYEYEVADDSTFYNFHSSVIDKAKSVFAKYHKLVLTNDLSRKEFLDLIRPIIKELDQLCTVETCNIFWNDEETDILIDFLKDMAQIAGHEFRVSHFYRRFEE